MAFHKSVLLDLDNSNIIYIFNLYVSFFNNIYYMMIYFLYYFIIDTIVDIIHPITKTCINNNSVVFFILLLHHLISCFLLIGWIFKSKSILLLHILTVVITCIYWFYNRNLCDLTVYVNKKCGWNVDQPFNDLLHFIGIKKVKGWNEFWHYIVIIIGSIISLYKLIKYK